METLSDFNFGLFIWQFFVVAIIIGLAALAYFLIKKIMNN